DLASDTGGTGGPGGAGGFGGGMGSAPMIGQIDGTPDDSASGESATPIHKGPLCTPILAGLTGGTVVVCTTCVGLIPADWTPAAIIGIPACVACAICLGATLSDL